jgi:two-component system response regulator WspF
MQGAVLLAGTSDHLVFTSPDTLGYSPVPRECSYRPSVDVFLDSVVRHWDGEAAGVLLTGMGRDGARGLRALRDVGHFTLAQDRASCAVYGMPKAAAELDAAMEILPLDKIAPRLLQQFRAKASPSS